MASCYHCGRSGASYRRTVTTGYSRGSWTSKKSYGSSSRTNYGVRSVCEDCALRIDKSSVIGSIIISIIISICLICYLINR